MLVSCTYACTCAGSEMVGWLLESRSQPMTLRASDTPMEAPTALLAPAATDAEAATMRASMEEVDSAASVTSLAPAPLRAPARLPPLAATANEAATDRALMPVVSSAVNMTLPLGAETPALLIDASTSLPMLLRAIEAAIDRAPEFWPENAPVSEAPAAVTLTVELS